MGIIFLLVWSLLGLAYFCRISEGRLEIPNKDKYRLVVLFGGPLVWIYEVGEFIISAVKPLFSVIDEWVRK